MQSKYIRVKEKKAEKKIEFYSTFGWTVVGEKEQLPHGYVGITIERDSDDLEGFDKIRNGERAYAQVSRPYPLLAIILFGIASLLLAAYFLTKVFFEFYITFLFASLAIYGLSIYALVVFLIVFIKRRSLQKKIVNNVGVEAGTIRELPLRNNIEKENPDTWTIANNL